MPSLTELREELYAKQDRLGQIFQEAGQDLDLSRVTLIDGDSEAKGAQIRAMQREINDLGKQRDELEALENIALATRRDLERATEPAERFPFGSANGKAAAGGNAYGGNRQASSLRDVLMQSKSYQSFRSHQAQSFQIDMPVTDFKTLITLTTVSPQNARRPDVVDMPLEERTVSDLMLQGNIDRAVAEYYEQTTFTNNATMTAEGTAKTESDLAWTLRTDPVRKVAHWLQATSEALADVPFLESQIRGMLAFGVRRKEEQQILTGDGTGQNITGIVNRSGIQTQARGADSNLDAIYKAMQKVRGSAGGGFAEPTGLVIHPDNWTAIKLAKSTDGIYLYGSPSDEGPDRLWGLMVRQTTGMTANTALVGAFRPYAEILRREGIAVLMSTEHASFAIENKVALIGESRLGLAVYRPSAFCTVTGLTV